MKEKRKNLSIILNFLIAVTATFAVALALITAKENGYSHWTKRLLYFTQQSNVWIGVTCLIFGILLLIEKKKGKPMHNWLYLFKYVFTVSITITGIIFCSLLAPFAEENIWYFSSVLTHVVVPFLSVVDFFLLEKMPLKRWYTFISLIPPLCYFVLATVLSAMNVDFGKGETFPYFFMNINSAVGLFGFRTTDTYPELGTFYWILVITLLIYGLAWAYFRLHPAVKNKK